MWWHDKERLSERAISILPAIWNTIASERLKLSNDGALSSAFPKRLRFRFLTWYFNSCRCASIFKAWRGRRQNRKYFSSFCAALFLSSRIKVKSGKRRASKFRPLYSVCKKHREHTHFPGGLFTLRGKGFYDFRAHFFTRKFLFSTSCDTSKDRLKHVHRLANWR